MQSSGCASWVASESTRDRPVAADGHMGASVEWRHSASSLATRKLPEFQAMLDRHSN